LITYIVGIYGVAVSLKRTRHKQFTRHFTWLTGKNRNLDTVFCNQC